MTEAKVTDEGVALPPDKGDPGAQAPAASQALAPRPTMEIGGRGVLLRSFEDLQRFSRMALESGAAPKGMGTIGQVCIAIQTGMEAGLTPMNALQAIVVINGNASWRGQSALGRIRADQRCRYIKAWTEGAGDAQKGVCISRRAGADREERTEFTVEQAKRAGLWAKAGPWSQYPDRQLMWRAVGFHTKDHWSDVLGGFPIDEEAQDYPAREERPARASIPPPPSPDPLLAEVVEIKATPVPDPLPATGPAEPPKEPAPCCGGDHGPSEPCPKEKETR